MNRIVLSGCQPEPLASYLKALGVLRLVSEQVDGAARGHWSPEGFVLTTTLTVGQLREFFLDRYQPTPVVSPWNGGSGFGEKDNVDGLNVIAASSLDRLQAYRDTISAVRRIGLLDEKADKAGYIQILRNSLPDQALTWMDAAAVLVEGGIRFPILLGTGGNDGRLDFSNNFMQRLCDALALTPLKKNQLERPAEWLLHSLFAEMGIAGVDVAIGQFDPGAAGGSNSSPQGKGKGAVNPWDYVLMIEGAVLFAASGVRRRGANKNEVSVPFTFAASAAGFASATDESGRGEIWAPMWAEAATLSAVQGLFSDGRITWAGEAARNGLNAFRGLATLQGDRRISQFVRYAIAERFGLSNVAVPVGRISAPAQARTDVAATQSLDRWLAPLRRKGDKLPAAALSLVRQVDASLVNLTVVSDTVGQAAALLKTLVLVADLELLCSRSNQLRDEVRPVGSFGRQLLVSEWSEALQPLIDVFGAEARLAWALASGERPRDENRPTRLREYVTPVSPLGAWTAGSLVEGLTTRPVAEVLAQVAMRCEFDGGSERGGAGAQQESSKAGNQIAFPSGRVTGTADSIALAQGGDMLNETVFRDCLRAFLLFTFDKVRPDQPISLAAPKSSAVAPAVVAAVLFHSGGEAGNPCPAGLPRQLAARSGQALSSLERSIRMAGGRPVLPSDGAVTPWMAAALLLRLRPPAHDAMRRACSFSVGDLDATTDSSYDGSVVDRTADAPSSVSPLLH